MYNFSPVNFVIFLVIANFTTLIIFKVLKNRNHVDQNLLKSKKTIKTVTSLGLVFLINFCIFVSWYILEENINRLFPNRYYIFFVSLILLTLMSFWDDLKEIDPKYRLIVQLILVYFSLTNLDLQSLNIPLKLIIFLSLVFWVYIINITNFIDGSDGHCAIHSISFFIGTLYLTYFFKLDSFSNFLAFINLPILIVFLLYNFPKAKAYMGDTGSVYLGYIIGFILLENIFLNKGLYFLSIFLYPIIDCTLTIVSKVFRGYYPWARLFDYYFLIPIKNGNNHQKVFYATIIYSVLNLIFVFLQVNYSDLFFILNVFNSLVLILYFKSYDKKKI